MYDWNQLDRFEDDEPTEPREPGAPASDGANPEQLRPHPDQQYFDFGEMLSPRLDQLDEMSGFKGDDAGNEIT